MTKGTLFGLKNQRAEIEKYFYEYAAQKLKWGLWF